MRVSTGFEDVLMTLSTYLVTVFRQLRLKLPSSSIMVLRKQLLLVSMMN